MLNINKYVGPPYSRTNIYVACVSNAAKDVDHLPLHSFAAAACSAPGTDRQTDTALF